MPHPRARRSRTPRRRARAATVALVLAVFAVGALGWGVRATSPSPGIVPPGDTRSEGEGAGLVGSPVGVALVVVALGVGAAGLTTLYLRIVRRD
jgi:hypothetical protein